MSKPKYSILLGLVVLSLATFSSAHYLYSIEKESAQLAADDIVNKVRADLISVTGEIRSFGSLHQSSSEGFSHVQYQLMSEDLLKHREFYNGSARYEVLQEDDLWMYEDELRDHGVFSFKAKGIDSAGSFYALESKEIYYSIIGYYPSNPVSLNYIGLDLSEFPKMYSRLKHSARVHTSIAMPAPENWPDDADTIITFPSYFGHEVPDTEIERERQTDGGYILSLNLERLIAARVPQSSGFSFTVTTDANAVNNSQRSAHRLKSDIGLIGDEGLFDPVQLDYTIGFGGTPVTVSLQANQGISKATLGKSVLVGIAVFVVYMLLLAVSMVRRTAAMEIKQKERVLMQVKERALVTLRSIGDAVLTTDQDGFIDYANPAALRLLKPNSLSLIGENLQKITSSFETCDIPSFQAENINEKNIESGRLVRVSNTSIVMKTKLTPLFDSEYVQIGSVLVISDVSNEYALTAELAHQAMHDALTGIANRRKFEAALNEVLAKRAQGESRTFGVGYIDLDQFKLINDTAGHAVGDDLLKKLAEEIQTVLDDSAMLARLGGDEFGLVITAENDQGVEEQVRRVYGFFQNYFYKSEMHLFAVRASIGLTYIRPHHAAMSEVLAEVDLACYAAKESGRNSYHIYDPENKDTRERQGEMHYLPILQKALTENQFLLFVQPIVSCDATEDSKVKHYECLLRIPGENGEAMAPYKFIKAAERYDMMREIDKWIVQDAFRQIVALPESESSTLFSINLSGQSAIDPGLPEYIESMLEKHGNSPKQICFELTETAVISNFTQAQKLINYLRNRGFTIALDDFGSGACSFGYLKNLKVDYLKIDGQFVKEINTNPVDLEMVRSIHNVGKALGIKTIAEFVESAEIMGMLADLKVDYAQGYHVSKPYPMKSLLPKDWQAAA